MSFPWLTESLRLTAFFDAPIGKDAHPDVEKTFAAEAEITQFRGPAKDLVQVASFGPGKLTLMTNGNRVDWLWTSQGSEADSLGAFNDTVDAFLSPGAVWLKSQSGITRVALGAVVAFPVEDRIEGYKALQSYLHAVQLDPENSTEFSYQINRPRVLKVRGEDIKANLLTKWFVASYVTSQLQVTSGGMVAGPPSVTNSRCSCELDLSTPAVHPFIFTGAVALDAVQLLAQEARRILTEGDHA